jgi:AcrR family transcriptional regulator
MMSPPADRILDTAARLFYAEGLKVGIDRIIAEAQVAKASFYHHYASKDELVVAFLRRRHATWMAWFSGRLEALCARRRPRLALVADVLREWFAEPAFRGCAFINAVADIGLAGEALGTAQSHKDELRDCLQALAERAGLAHAAAIADEALVIVEGAIVRAHMSGDPGAADVAARLLARLDAAPRLRRTRSRS